MRGRILLSIDGCDVQRDCIWDFAVGLGANELCGGCVTSAGALNEWAHARGTYTGSGSGGGDCASSCSIASNPMAVIYIGMHRESSAQFAQFSVV